MPRTVPVSALQAPGNLVTGALWNAGPAASNTFLTAVPVAVVYQITVQSVPNGTWTSVNFDGTILDTDNQHSNSVNNSRLTAQVAGWYVPAGCGAFASSSASARGVKFAKNGTVIQGTTTFAPPVSTGNATAYPACALPVFLNIGDYIELQVSQSTGGALNTFNSADIASTCTLFWLHS